MWLAYIISCCIATACLTIIIYSVASKYLLLYVHGSLEAKVTEASHICTLVPIRLAEAVLLRALPP